MLNSKFILKYGLFICLLSIGLIILIFTNIIKKDGTSVIVSVDGKDIKTFSLSDNITYDINEKGYNKLIIENGYAWIASADCPDSLCINFGKISKSGESIICLPHKLVIRIESNSNKEELDAYAK